MTLLACGFLAARAAGQYLAVSATRPGAGAEQERQYGNGLEPDPNLARAPERSTQVVVERNLFCSDCAPVAPQPEDPDGSPTEMARSGLPLRLVATLIGERGQAAYAALLETDTGRTRVATIGDLLDTEAKLLSVQQRRILLDNGGRTEFLPLEEDGAATPGLRLPPPPVARPAVSGPGSLGAGVRFLGNGRYEVQRAALEKVLSNTARLASAARIIPAQVGGQPAGFMLERIRPGSLYNEIGLRDGDIVQAVNGHSLRTPEDALMLMTQLRRAQHLAISFLRQSKPITHDYTIR